MSSRSRRKRKHLLKADKPEGVKSPITTTQPSASVAAPKTTPHTIKAEQPTPPTHPHVGAELRRIGILAAALLTTLGVLSQVL